MHSQAAKSAITQIPFTVRQNPFQGIARIFIGGNSMAHTSKTFFLALATFVLALITSGAAYANTSQAISHFNKLGQIQTSLTNIDAQIRAFPIKSSYCQAPHANDKSGDQAALDALSAKANAEKRRYNLSRRVLTRIISNDGRARAAIGKLTPGGSGSIVDGSYFAGIAALNNAIAAAYRAKITELNNAPTRPCGTSTGNGSSVSMPVFAVANPLLDVSTTGTYEDIGTLSVPARFCHKDEKRELLNRISAMRQTAQANEVVAEKLRDKLRQLETQTKAKRQAAWSAADAAAKAGQTTTQNNQVKQLRAYDAALAKIAAGIRQAQAAQRKWRNRDLQLEKDWDAVQAMPISDCTDPNLTPAGVLGGTQLQGVGSAAPNLKPVDIPSIPAKVCVDAVKREIGAKAFTALRNSWHNRDQWNARIVALNSALQTATGAASQPLIDARAEARKESANWIKLVKTASDANDRAKAIIVEDCSNSGGLLEIGKMSTSMPGIHIGVPEAETTPYDLPKVPEYVCTWEEKQALIARAAKARKAASANHSQWGARASALGGLLYGANAVGGDRTNLLKAHAEARAQSDYWAEQMLDVAHRVYWQLRELEVRDCEEPENKNSMNSPSGTGNATGGSRIGSLQDAINNRPVYNGSNGGGVPTGRDCIIQQGGCFYPDPRNDWMYGPLQSENGFDGSEAENALHHTLRNVEPANGYQTHENENENRQENRTPENHTMPGNSGVKVEPNTENSTPTQSGTFSSGVGLELETQPIEYRNGSENTTVTKMPGIPKYGNLNGPRPTSMNDDLANSILHDARVHTLNTPKVEIESLPTQNVPKVEVGSINNSRVGGTMIQVKPPVLVIRAGAADPAIASLTDQQAAALEAAGGQ